MPPASASTASGPPSPHLKSAIPEETVAAYTAKRHQIPHRHHTRHAAAKAIQSIQQIRRVARADNNENLPPLPLKNIRAPQRRYIPARRETSPQNSRSCGDSMIPEIIHAMPRPSPKKKSAPIPNFPGIVSRSNARRQKLPKQFHPRARANRHHPSNQKAPPPPPPAAPPAAPEWPPTSICGPAPDDLTGSTTDTHTPASSFLKMSPRRPRYAIGCVQQPYSFPSGLSTIPCRCAQKSHQRRQYQRHDKRHVKHRHVRLHDANERWTADFRQSRP